MSPTWSNLLNAQCFINCFKGWRRSKRRKNRTPIGDQKAHCASNQDGRIERRRNCVRKVRRGWYQHLEEGNGYCAHGHALQPWESLTNWLNFNRERFRILPGENTMHQFLVTTKRLYMRVCPSVGRSVGNQLFLRPTRSDLCRVYGLVSKMLRSLSQLVFGCTKFV